VNPVCGTLTRVFLTVVLFCVFTGTAGAQLLLEEGKVTLTVSGGDRISKKITLHNNSAEEVPVRVYWEDFQYQPPYDGTKLFVPAGTGEKSMAQWVSFSPQQFTLPAYSQQMIEYSLSVPSSIQGGYYGTLFFEQAPVDAQGVTGVNIVTRIGCLFFVEAVDSLRQASIDGIESSAGEIKGTFTNQGDVVLIPQITYYIMDPGGMVVDRGEVKKKYVAPKGVASWEIKMPAGLSAGEYAMVITADLGDGQALVKELTLAVGPGEVLRIKNVQD